MGIEEWVNCKEVIVMRRAHTERITKSSISQMKRMTLDAVELY